MSGIRGMGEVVMTVLDIADAIRPALVDLGLSGELDVRMDGSRSTSWIGQPSEGDPVVIVQVQSMKGGGTKKSTATRR